MRILHNISAGVKKWLFIRPRLWKYARLSTCRQVSGTPVKFQPVLINGKGRVAFGKNVQLGVINAPEFYTGYTYLEARNASAAIHFGNAVAINNSCAIIAHNSEIRIDDDVLIGLNCYITDSDFHAIAPGERTSGTPECRPVHIKKNVFIGSHVSILKGVTIGENSVIAHGAVVVNDIPDNVVAGGVPAKVLKSL